MTSRPDRLPLLAISLVFTASLLLAAAGFGKAPAKGHKAHAAAKPTPAKKAPAPAPIADPAPPADAQKPADTPASGPGTSAQTAALIAAGKGVYGANGCARCHVGGRAPDLSHEGARHTATELASYVKNPQQWDPGSRMPAFAGKISDADLSTLGTYLASLK